MYLDGAIEMSPAKLVEMCNDPLERGHNGARDQNGEDRSRGGGETEKRHERDERVPVTAIQSLRSRLDLRRLEGAKFVQSIDVGELGRPRPRKERLFGFLDLPGG